MPEQEQKKEKEEGVLKRLKDTLIEKFSTTLVENISDRFHELTKKLQETVYLTQKKIIEQFYVSAFFFAGCLFMGIAALFYLTDTLHWTKTQASAVLGISLMVAALLLKQYVLKTRSI